MLERAFELPLRRLFRVALQPVELTRAVARAMEASGCVSNRGVQVANQYLVSLHPQDFQAFASWCETMERELSDYLQQYALQRGWHCPGRPRVLLQQDNAVPTSRPRVTSSTVEAVVPPAPATIIGRVPDGTEALPLRPTPPKPAVPVHALAWLEMPDQPLWPMQKSSVRLGRAPDNDLVLDEAGVSRYHARIDYAANAFVLRDLASSNGTWHHGASITEQVLQSGETFTLGKLPVRFWAPQ